MYQKTSWRSCSDSTAKQIDLGGRRQAGRQNGEKEKRLGGRGRHEYSVGFRDPGACLLRATVSDDEISTAGVLDDDAPKLVEGPSFLMNSNPSGEDNLDGGEAVDESTDSPLSKFDIKVQCDLANTNFKILNCCKEPPLRNHFIVPQMDSEGTYPILFFGAGSLFALWISSAVISALDSVPVVPKVLEVIGLGFTAWFTSRYFIFKENRDEFFLKLQDVKERILGPCDD
ncbi:hypothetical protein ZIOFF_006835 [Zingiber officinale]|uniref:Cyanobacterial aminoacyl-tRNA synthetase CAAD domain-containing protein n=1 Tax=Zingiber officinale TaxID=94328 RepID=A0A8J5LPE2_ZINOF|nr:hypothetical protein ZIOFF_006835 [Zingiber officinale]